LTPFYSNSIVPDRHVDVKGFRCHPPMHGRGSKS
jgi:hypothetical protein